MPIALTGEYAARFQGAAQESLKGVIEYRDSLKARYPNPRGDIAIVIADLDALIDEDSPKMK